MLRSYINWQVPKVFVLCQVFLGIFIIPSLLSISVKVDFQLFRIFITRSLQMSKYISGCGFWGKDFSFANHSSGKISSRGFFTLFLFHGYYMLWFFRHQPVCMSWICGHRTQILHTSVRYTLNSGLFVFKQTLHKPVN